MVNFVTAGLALSVAFTQPGTHLLAEPCTASEVLCRGAFCARPRRRRHADMNSRPFKMQRDLDANCGLMGLRRLRYRKLYCKRSKRDDEVGCATLPHRLGMTLSVNGVMILLVSSRMDRILCRQLRLFVVPYPAGRRPKLWGFNRRARGREPRAGRGFEQ